MWKTLNEECKVCSSCSHETSKLALPPVVAGTRQSPEMCSHLDYSEFYSFFFFLALGVQLHDFLSVLYSFVSSAGFIAEPTPGFLAGFPGTLTGLAA